MYYRKDSDKMNTYLLPFCVFTQCYLLFGALESVKIDSLQGAYQTIKLTNPSLKKTAACSKIHAQNFIQCPLGIEIEYLKS